MGKGSTKLLYAPHVSYVLALTAGMTKLNEPM